MLAMLFDCDGVLVDSEILSCRAWLPVMARRGVYAELSEMERFVGKSDRDILDHFRRTTRLDLGEEVIAEREQEYFHLARGKLQSFPGARATLDELKRRGTPLAVVSSGRPQKIAFNLEQAGLEDLFDIVCSVTEVAHGKPAPDLFLLGARRLGLAPEQCVVLEDSVFGIQAAQAARMTALGFASTHPAHGLEAAGAARVLGSYAELLPVLEALSAPSRALRRSE
jgi:HAD superfamily hydrolase (TIGR01509 family)